MRTTYSPLQEQLSLLGTSMFMFRLILTGILSGSVLFCYVLVFFCLFLSLSLFFLLVTPSNSLPRGTNSWRARPFNETRGGSTPKQAGQKLITLRYNHCKRWWSEEGLFSKQLLFFYLYQWLMSAQMMLSPGCSSVVVVNIKPCR